MAQGARVDSFEALRAFRAALYKFADQVNVALTDAEGELHRTVGWVERDQQAYWQFQLRKRHEHVVRCQEALRMKKLFKSADGRPGSTVDEEKALALAQKRFAIAEQKNKATIAWSRKLPKDILMYKGQVQRLSTAVQSDIPVAGAQLSRLVATLEAYVASMVQSQAAGSDSGKLVTSGVVGMSMGRAGGEKGVSPWAPLRKVTPPGPAREKAAGNNPKVELRPATLTAAELENLVALPAERTSYDPQARVVVDQQINLAGRIYLERVDIGFGGDSGWYIGSAEEKNQQPGGSIGASELLALRPDLIDILTLPRGFLIVMDRGGLVSILNGRDEELLKSAEPEVLPPAGPLAATPPADAPASAGAVVETQT